MIEVGILSEEDKVELLNGEIVNMSPKGSKHASCIQKIVSWLPQLIDKKVQLQVKDPIQIPDLSEPEPDLAIVKAKSDYYVDAHPLASDVLLVIEVADSSLEIDRQIKAPSTLEQPFPNIGLSTWSIK